MIDDLVHHMHPEVAGTFPREGLGVAAADTVLALILRLTGPYAVPGIVVQLILPNPGIQVRHRLLVGPGEPHHVRAVAFL